MKQTYYHYTSRENAAGIAECMMIRKSQRHHLYARFGEGVYLTQVLPWEGKKIIAYNNYDGRSPQAVASIVRRGNVTIFLRTALTAQLLI